MGVLRKKKGRKKETYCYSEIFFIEILINVKAGRVNWGARKVYHGRRVGQACYTGYNGGIRAPETELKSTIRLKKFAGNCLAVCLIQIFLFL
jgi:hypothetical protein